MEYVADLLALYLPIIDHEAYEVENLGHFIEQLLRVRAFLADDQGNHEQVDAQVFRIGIVRE